MDQLLSHCLREIAFDGELGAFTQNLFLSCAGEWRGSLGSSLTLTNFCYSRLLRLTLQWIYLFLLYHPARSSTAR